MPISPTRRTPSSLSHAKTVSSLMLALIVLLAGCTGGADPSTAEDSTGPVDPSGSASATDAPTTGGGTGTAPGTQPSSNVKVDPNGTFEGGAHIHDLWGGDTEVVIMDKDVKTGPGGVCVGYSLPNGCNGGDSLVRFDPPTDSTSRPQIVFPGTGKMEIKVRVAQLVHPFDIGVGFPDQPNPTKFKLKVDAAQKTFVIEGINESRTDPPHFRSSGWFFQILTTPGSLPHAASAYQGPMHWTVTVFRDPDRALPVDPPHPELWGQQTQLTLFQGKVNVDVKKTPAATSTGGNAGGNPTIPENNTVLVGTGKMRVTIAWTNNNPDVSKLAIGFCPANGYCGYSNAINVRPPVTTDGASRRVFEFDVRPEWWDSPYATRTEWRFTWYFEDPAGGEYGAITGTIEWTIEILKSN